MSYIMVDVEADGPIPGDYSMISFGAVVVDENLDKTFYGQLAPISDKFIPEALAVSGHTREGALSFDDPKKVMEDFAVWLKSVGRDKVLFISDNNGFDWMFICWYFHHFVGNNVFQNFKHLRKTRHTRHPVDDARGNAEALLTMKKEYGLKIKL